MGRSKELWGNEIPILQDYASQLINLANEIVSTRSGPFEKDDFIGPILDAFTSKQINHLRSICILIDSEQYQDAEIVGRSSFEGMCLLLWLVNGPKEENRALKWFAYEFIEGYRKISYFNEIIDIETKKVILRGVQEYAHLFLTKKANDLLEQGKVLPNSDPFVKGWPSKNIPQIVEELKQVDLIDPNIKYYEKLYGCLSQWTHWTSQGIGGAFKYEENRLIHDLSKQRFKGAGSIIFGILSLAKSAYLFNNHFESGFQGKLDDLGYSKFMAKYI